jgi:hypothetical protein
MDSTRRKTWFLYLGRIAPAPEILWKPLHWWNLRGAMTHSFDICARSHRLHQASGRPPFLFRVGRMKTANFAFRRA